MLALAALLAVVAGARASARWRAVLMLVLGELYLRRHYVDLPMLVDLVYFEILIGLGAGAARLCRVSRLRATCAAISGSRSPASCCGVSARGRCPRSASDRCKILRIYTLLLAVPAFAARQTPLSVFLVATFSALGAHRARIGRRARRVVSLPRRAHEPRQRIRSLVVWPARRLRARRRRLGVQVARSRRAGQLLPETLRAAADSGQRARTIPA